MKSAQSSQDRYQSNVRDVVLVCLLLTFNRFTPSFRGFFVKIEQVTACWDDNDNNNDGSSHNKDVDRTDFAMNLILFF